MSFWPSPVEVFKICYSAREDQNGRASSTSPALLTLSYEKVIVMAMNLHEVDRFSGWRILHYRIMNYEWLWEICSPEIKAKAEKCFYYLYLFIKLTNFIYLHKETVKLYWA